MGGTHHPFLGVLGVMSAKNTAVNLMILTTFLSFLLYRRANKRTVVPWARTGTMIQTVIFVLAAVIVLFYGVYGYFVTAIVRIGFSVYQVLAVLAAIGAVVALDVMIMRGAESYGAIRWGQMPPRSQYALFILAVTFTWLMGLMGFARSGIRQHWHIWEVMRDTRRVRCHPALGIRSTGDQLVRGHLPRTGRLYFLGRQSGREAHHEPPPSRLAAPHRPPSGPGADGRLTGADKRCGRRT